MAGSFGFLKGANKNICSKDLIVSKMNRTILGELLHYAIKVSVVVGGGAGISSITSRTPAFS